MTRFAAITLFMAIAFASCKTKQTETPAETKTDSVATIVIDSTADNVLTQTEKNEGWESLFDGTTMQGWRMFRGKENNSWEVVDGTLHCKAPAPSGDKRADLITTNAFENFELTFDWKIAPKHNSGVMFHITEEFEEPYATGPEYQVIDDTGYPDKLKEAQHSASNYDMHPASAQVVKPAGEWNTGKIVVNGTHVEHWLNGTKVVDYELGSDDWKKRHAASKWKKDFPGYATAKSGFIGLQDHGGEVWYKNIFIKTL